MKLLSIANCPALEHLGSGYIIGRYANGLRELGHSVDLVEPDDYEVLRGLRPRANSYRQAIGMLIALRRALRRKSYDMVEFWGGEGWLATKWLAGLRGARPLIVQHSNGPEPRYSRMLEAAGLLRLSPLQRWHAYRLVPAAFRSPDAVVTISRYDLSWLEEMRLPRSGRRLAIETPLAECFLGRDAKPRQPRLLGFCGTWLPKKGITLIVRDITRVLREFGDWRFLVLGTDPNAGVLGSFPPEIRDRIEVAPMIKDKEALAQQYERMEIFLLPSVIESFGVALAEAMACGCAPIATRVGFAASLENGRDIVLLERPESPHLYDAVKGLICDPERRRRLAAAARQRVQALRWRDAVSTLSQAYGEWLSEHRHVSRALHGI